MKWWDEFKKFAFKGNMLDLAVAVVIGTAFTAVVNSLVKDIIMPIASYPISAFATPGKSYTDWAPAGIRIGNFLGELLNFLLIAFAVFLLINKLMSMLLKLAAPPKPGDPVNKECPFCLMTIPFKAVKCGHCTADLPVPPAIVSAGAASGGP